MNLKSKALRADCVMVGDTILVDGIRVGSVNVTTPSLQTVLSTEQIGDDVELVCSGGASFSTSRNNSVFVF